MDIRNFDDDAAAEVNLNKNGRRDNIPGLIFLTATYMIVTSVIYALFFYRGGEADVGFGGYLLDASIIGFLVYTSTDEHDEDRGLQTFYGSILFVGGEILLKTLFIYPQIEKIMN